MLLYIAEGHVSLHHFQFPIEQHKWIVRGIESYDREFAKREFKISGIFGVLMEVLNSEW